ncbi:Vitamin B12-binding protein [Meiothermus luteus]|jgi:iron complex transport system substrate-binding protein|uniref:Vitamin B12-binding protein n=1 Tax=Meiothermus luteus TaxID=2026184 RepID=A0A399ETL7_9DEIN|nr:ABC transporter substrate-binding protein [Meiothermus luteus]RIH87328.1 Vitamin B12-binding protein [Meiothermus luteus]RMH53608.1 MAG: ABC transporter substrate-binding protein [Deinococcota bacterium]
MKRLFFLLLAFVLSLALAQFPLTLTDDQGRSITLQKPPQRIVTMLPSATETICSLSEAACRRIVATDQFSNWPERVRSLPKAGGLINPNTELIISLKPDLVIVNSARLVEPLERAGLTVYVTRPQTYADIFRTARAYGQMLGLRAEAERLVARVQAEVFALESRAAKAKERPLVYYEIDPTPYTAGPSSFIGALIEKARGRNIIPAELGNFPKINPELVVQQKPQVIVVTHPEVGGIRNRPGWGAIPAVQQNRICAFSGEATDLLSRPGPRVAQGLKFLIECFHPELK